MTDGEPVDRHVQTAPWTTALRELDRRLNEPERGVSVLEQQVAEIAADAVALGTWAPIFEAWTVLVRWHESVTSGEALTIWASNRRETVDYSRLEPALDFRVFEADLVLGVWPELRWGEGGNPPGHAPGEREKAWLDLWEALRRATIADTGDAVAGAGGRASEEKLATFISFSHLAATVFSPRSGNEALGMPAHWRLGLLEQVRAFKAAAVGAPGGETLALPRSGDTRTCRAIASGFCVLFHHASRGFGDKPGQGRSFDAALDDLIAAPLPVTEAPGTVWPNGARRMLERLFRFWAVGDAVLRASLEGALGLVWSDSREALLPPEAPEPQDVVERIALIGGTNVGKTSFLFGSERLRQIERGADSKTDWLPVIKHAWMEGTNAKQRIERERERWLKGERSKTEVPELLAVTGIHSFQSFEIVDMKGEDLLPQGDAVMEYAMRDLFTFRPPAALAIMLDTVAPLSSNDLVSVKRFVRLARESHRQRMPPVHLIANKADSLIVSLRKPMSGAVEAQKEDATFVDALCKKALDLGVLMRRAGREQGANRDRSILPFLMREALEAEELSASPTLGVVVDHLLESEGALMQALISEGATNVVLNFTCSAPPGRVPGALAGIRAFWNEIWGWAANRRHQAIEVQRSAFVDRFEKDLSTVNSLLASSALFIDEEKILKSYDDVVKQADENSKTLSERLETGFLPPAPQGFADWLSESDKGRLPGLANAVKHADKAWHVAELQLTTAVDTMIGSLISLLGIDPDAKIETIQDRQRQGNLVNKGRDWLDERQVIVAGREAARSLPALIASDKLPEPLLQAGKLLEKIEESQQDAGFWLLREMVQQQEDMIQSEAGLERALPGGPDANPRLFHHIHGALLDDCFWKNEPWRTNHRKNRSVILLQEEALLGVKALLIGRAGTPNPNIPPDWRYTLAPMLRLLAEYRPKFPQLTMRRYESDAVKADVLTKMLTRRRVEGLIAALEASLAAHAALHKMPGIAARIRQLTMIEALLPALRKLGFDAPAFEELVRRGTTKERERAVVTMEENEAPPGLTAIAKNLRKQLGLWPHGLLSAVQNQAPVIQPIRAEIDVFRTNLSGRFGSRILPEPNQEDPKSLGRAVTSLQVGVRLLEASAGDARHERAELTAELRNLGSKITKMRMAVDAVKETIRTDILVERYQRFLALKLERSAQAIAKLDDGLGVVDGGIVQVDVSLEEVEQRYLMAMKRYFEERANP